MSKASSLLLLGGVLVAVLVAGALVWEPWRTATETEPKSTVALSTVGTRFEGAPVPRGKTAPDFTLKTADGTALRLSAQKGKLVLITFLYTRCRDVCPLIATKLDSIARDLGKDARSVRILAISVDPKGDTASAVRAYDRSHGLGPEFRWLIGTRTKLLPGLARIQRRSHGRGHRHRRAYRSRPAARPPRPPACVLPAADEPPGDRARSSPAPRSLAGHG